MCLSRWWGSSSIRDSCIRTESLKLEKASKIILQPLPQHCQGHD